MATPTKVTAVHRFVKLRIFISVTQPITLSLCACTTDQLKSLRRVSVKNKAKILQFSSSKSLLRFLHFPKLIWTVFLRLLSLSVTVTLFGPSKIIRFNCASTIQRTSKDCQLASTSLSILPLFSTKLLFSVKKLNQKTSVSAFSSSSTMICWRK
jgi:hypothetical protein